MEWRWLLVVALSAHVLLVWSMCRASANAEAVMSHRKRRRLMRERLKFNPRLR